MTYIGNIQIPDNLFSEDKRNEGYFLRIPSYNTDVEKLIQKCVPISEKCGALINEKLKAPDANDISKCTEAMKNSFTVSTIYIINCLSSYLNIPGHQLGELPRNIRNTLEVLSQLGKTESVIKNTFVKYMFWIKTYLYSSLGSAINGCHPLVFYAGQMSLHEMLFFAALSDSGYDIMVLETSGDTYYKSIDKEGKYSSALFIPNGTSFPQNFSLKKNPAPNRHSLHISERSALSTQQSPSSPSSNSSLAPRGNNSTPEFCTNAWLSGNIFTDIVKPVNERGDLPNTIYNCFVRINGVEDSIAYYKDIYQIYLQEKSKRNLLIFDSPLSPPSNEEISKVRRGNYNNINALINDISKNFVHFSIELQKMMCNAFSETIIDFFEQTNDLRKALNISVYLVCWLKKYQNELFKNYKSGDVSCVIIMNGCQSDKEACFIKMLAKLPVDVLILMPDLSKKCMVSDAILYERNFTNSMAVDKFPQSQNDIQMGTTAYYAERQLDNIMYNDSGLYRDYQFSKANSIILKPIYEEINILWHQELKFRPSFNIVDSCVNMPVFFSKISGVKNGNLNEYWNSIIDLISENTMVIKNGKLTEDSYPTNFAVDLIKNGKLRYDAIKKCAQYQYGFLKEETQDYILQKIQTLLDKNTIILENGIQYKILSIALSMNKDILRKIQVFDFTKVNPKLIYINTTENIISQNDSIFLALLNQIGFDILLFIPTGYQCAEKYYDKNTIVTHQIGDYVFDLQIPDLTKKRTSLFNRIFARK